MPRPRAPARLFAVLALALAGPAALPSAGADAVPDTPAVSRADAGGAPGNLTSYDSVVSAGGRYVAFTSGATNLDPADRDRELDVFVRDTATNTTSLVSRATGPAGAHSNGWSSRPVMTADGRFVAFDSSATNLDPAATDGGVFVRDLVAHTTTLVSGDGGRPAISGDGRHVAYVIFRPTPTTTAHPGGFIREVHVRDLATNTATLVSRASGPTGAPADDSSAGPVVSDDGRYIAFCSDARNLDAAATDGAQQVYVRDTRTDTTTLISRASGPNGSVARASSDADAISGDGRYVVFTSSDALGIAQQYSANYVFVRDRQTDTTTLVSQPSSEGRGPDRAYDGVISADGRTVAYTANRSGRGAIDEFGEYLEVDLFDTVTGTTSLVSRGSGAPGPTADGTSSSPSISPCGRFVSFDSVATNLDPAHPRRAPDIFLRDRVRNTTVLVSRATGPPLPGPVFPAKLSVARARVQRSSRTLDVLAPITARASGRVRVEFRAAGRTTRFTVPVDTRKRRVRFTRRIPAVQAALGTGILTLTYSGDADTQPQTVRLRAAAGHADLKAGRPRIVDGRLVAGGTVTPKARGVVRVQLVYQLINPATTRTVQFTAPISGGRYRLDTKLSDTVATERAGTVHSYVLFTGYLKQRIRGELRSYQVLGSR